MTTEITRSFPYIDLKVEIPPIEMSRSEFVSPKQPKRCGHSECKKKLTLTDFDCKCGIRFCSAHRHAETHACTFNYKSLSTPLVKCVAEKLDRV